MKMREKGGQLVIETNVYQTRSGAIYLNWVNNTTIKLEKDVAENVCYDIPDFDIDSFRNYYQATLSNPLNQ